VIRRRQAGAAGLAVAMLLLAACGPALPPGGVRLARVPEATPFTPPALAETPTAAPSATATAAPTLTPSPVVRIDPTFMTPEPAGRPADATGTPTATLEYSVVEVSDQPLSPENALVVSRVASTQDGWVVIFGAAGAGLNDVLGYAPVNAGENRNIRVEVDPERLTEALIAVLYHGRTGGEPYAPGVGEPGTNQWGEVALSRFGLSGSVIVVADQPLGAGSTVSVPFVLSELPGWLAIHADEHGVPGPVIGVRRVAQGITRDAIVQIDPAGATGTLYAMLHVDTGAAGVFEFPAADPVAEHVQGGMVVQSFRVTGGG